MIVSDWTVPYKMIKNGSIIFNSRYKDLIIERGRLALQYDGRLKKDIL
jgi:hypothetical protein